MSDRELRRQIVDAQGWLAGLPPRVLIALLAEVGSPYGGPYSRIAAQLIRGELRTREFSAILRASSTVPTGVA